MQKIRLFAAGITCAATTLTFVLSASAADNLPSDDVFSATIDSADHSAILSPDVDLADPDFIRGYEEGLQQMATVYGSRPGDAARLYAAQGDGCTLSPDSWGSANFRPACDRHDLCYSRQSSQDRLTCDNLFHVDLVNTCWAAYNGQTAKHQSCKGVAWAYYQGVRKFGSGHYQGRGQNN